nr:hypothetical protein [Riboviria sp.]
MQRSRLTLICGIIACIVEKHTLPTIPGKIFGRVRIENVGRLSFRIICHIFDVIVQKIARTTNVELPHGRLEVMRLVRGSITDTRSMLEVRVQSHRTLFIRDSASAQFKWACYRDAEASGSPQYASNRTADCTVCHFALSRWVILRPLGIPSAHLPQPAARGAQVNESLERDIIQVGNGRNDKLLLDNKVIERMSCQRVMTLRLPGYLHGLFRESTSVLRDNRLLTIYLETNFLHGSDILPGGTEHAEKIITSDYIRAAFMARAMNAKLVQERECEETQRRSHLDTATRHHGTPVRIGHPDGREHSFDIVLDPFRKVKCVEDSGPQCLSIFVGYVISSVRKIRRHYCAVTIQGTPENIPEFLRTHVLIEVHIWVRLKYGPQLPTDDITGKKRCGWELAENPGLISRLRNSENVHVVRGNLFIRKDSSFDNGIVEVLLMGVKVLAEHDWPSPHNLMGIVHKVAKPASRARRNVSACRSFRWMEGHPRIEQVTTLVYVITSVTVNLVRKAYIQLRLTGHYTPMISECLVYDKFAPNRKHPCNACKLCTRLCMTAEAAKPVSECTRDIPRVFRLLSSYRPNAVVEGQQLDLLAYILLTTETLAGFYKPSCKQLGRNQILKWSLVYRLDDNGDTPPNVCDETSLSPIRQGRHWQMIPMTCPDNTGVDRPRQDVLR